jgi:DNA-binding NarL/FixJ family response regulator
MTIRRRPMEPKDVLECAEIIAKHPVIGPRYGNRIGDLSNAWLRLFSCEAARGLVLQAADGPRAPICFVGISVFLNDDFVREMKTAPLRWIGPEIMKRILEDHSPVLSNDQFREANSRGGLNLLVWEGCIRPEFEANADISRNIMDSFIEAHSGYLLKEVIDVQVLSVERLRWTFQSGGFLWNPVSGRYEESFNKDPQEIIKNPHIIGTTRKAELNRRESWNASWAGSLFDYHPPRCGFSPSEQRLLLKALEGGTDQDLSRELNISVPTVKKMWLSVYRRTDDRLPELNPNRSEPDVEMNRRGKEKSAIF